MAQKTAGGLLQYYSQKAKALLASCSRQASTFNKYIKEGREGERERKELLVPLYQDVLP